MELSEKARKLKNEYARRWRQQNKDKVKASQERYWENRAKELDQSNVTDTSVTTDTNSLNVTDCLHCGNEFQSKRTDAKYCSAKCRVAYNRNNHH